MNSIFANDIIIKKYLDIFSILTKKCQGKKIVIFGYQGNGYFLRWFLKSFENLTVDYIIDNRDYIYDCKVFKPLLLDYNVVNPNNSVIIFTQPRSEYTEGLRKKYNFSNENDNYIYITELLYTNAESNSRINYFSWLENMYGMDLLNPEYMYDKTSDSENYSASKERGIYNICEVLHISEKDALFEIGSGKGAAALGFYLHGFNKIACVELDYKLYSIMVENYKKSSLLNKFDCYNLDASMIKKEYDYYNYFYMYNPFQGETFKTVIKNIEMSLIRKPRKIFFIYGNPYMHKYLIEESKFKLVRQVETDFQCRYVNIYEEEGLR